MAISSRFNFVSPGISIQEIDNSQLPAEPINSGPAIIGRLNQGPGLRPVKVNSRSEFVSCPIKYPMILTLTVVA